MLVPVLFHVSLSQPPISFYLISLYSLFLAVLAQKETPQG